MVKRLFLPNPCVFKRRLIRWEDAPLIALVIRAREITSDLLRSIKGTNIKWT